MMKKICAIILLLSAALSVEAQNITTLFRQRTARKPDTKQMLQLRNMQLSSSIDSLQLIIDSLRNAEPVEEAVEEVVEEEKPVKWQDHDEAQQDSLLHLWYNTSKALDFETVDEYDMDSVSFTTDVPDEELIRRLKDMNSSITLPFNETVKNYMILYSEKIRTRTERAMGLSEYYFPIIEEAFARYGIPLELKYLAIIESMLNPTATSRAGARGMWQFMYKTARGYGLHIDSFIDERLDVEKSVDAAARYLRDAYRVFGDWSIAISSYNCGPGNTIKAIRRAGGSSNFWDIYAFLPRETRGYMPAFVGAMYAFTYYREYGLCPAEVGMPVQTDTFEIRRKLHFRQINEVVGIPYDDIKNLNPKYLQDIIPGTVDQPCELRIPYKWTNAFMAANPDSLYGHRVRDLFDSEIDLEGYAGAGGGTPRQQRVSYKVKSGDSLGKIAVRNRTTVANLKKWNNLRSDAIRVGQVLYIYKTVYVKEPAKDAPDKKASASAKAKEKPAVKPSAAPAPVPADSTSTVPADSVSTAAADTLMRQTAAADTLSTAEPKAEYVSYTVKPGDTLFKIAKMFPGVVVSDIKIANGISADTIRPGQKLRIPNK